MADIYAIPPEGCEDYLTAGKKYKVEKTEGDQAFEIINDIGSNSYCLWEGCSHARGDWTRVDDALEGYNPDAVRDVVEALRLLLPVNVANNSYIDDDVMIPVDIPMSELRVALAALARLGGAS